MINKSFLFLLLLAASSASAQSRRQTGNCNPVTLPLTAKASLDLSPMPDAIPTHTLAQVDGVPGLSSALRDEATPGAGAPAGALQPSGSRQPSAAAYSEKLSRSSLLFAENRGQVADMEGRPRPDILFSGHSGGVKVFLAADGIHYQFEKVTLPTGYEQDERKVKDHARQEALREKIKTETHRFTLSLVGANPQPKVRKEEKSDFYENFYLAHCPDGITGVRSWGRVVMEDVYPGIDWVVYSNGAGLKYDFIVHPGADASLIKLRVQDADEVRIGEDGALVMKTTLGEVREAAPVASCGGAGVTAAFKQDGEDNISFALGGWDKTQTLIIDPSVNWATYYGGTTVEYGYSCATDAAGNVYMAGLTGSTSAIAATGAHQSSFGGVSDAFLAKFSVGGTRQWSTYYGGANSDYGYGCATDAAGNVYLAGYTTSASAIATTGAHQVNIGGVTDAFLAKFNGGGARQWSTYYGGAGSEEGYGCATDAAGNVYLTGFTTSSLAIATTGAHQTSIGGFSDAFLAKFSGGGARQWGTYYGGSGSDYGYGCATDAAGNVHLAGFTSSSSAIATTGAHQSSFGGVSDAFLAKFSGGGARQWGTYYGGASSEEGRGCATDAAGNVYLTGSTSSSSAIATTGAHQTSFGGLSDAFLTKFNGGGVRQWGTYYGGAGSEEGYGCATDAAGNVYLTGFTTSASAIATTGAHQTSIGGLSDAFLTKFSGGARQWGTYYGSSNVDESRGCATDAAGNVHLAGFTNSATAIASSGHQNSIGGGYDAFLAQFATGVCPAGTRVYVDSSVGVSGNGTSWAQAYKTVWEGLEAANDCSNITEVWVKKGTYFPMVSSIVKATSRDSSLRILRNGIKVYGGFGGTDTTMATRNPVQYRTILSGDIGTVNSSGDNSHHVVTVIGTAAQNIDTSTRLDGFEIRGGNANGTNTFSVSGSLLEKNSGGGIYNYGQGNNNGCSPTITACTFISNNASAGGAICNNGTGAGGMSNPVITGCTFTSNSANSRGGAISNSGYNGGVSSPTIANCTFHLNNSVDGGAIYTLGLTGASNVTIVNCTFHSNSASTYGGAIATACDPIIPGSLVITNSIFYNNTAPNGSDIFNIGGTSITVSYSITQSIIVGQNNQAGINPQFVNTADPDGPDNIWATADDGLALSATSTALNAGNNVAIPAGITTDITGAQRIQGTAVDMGAYERTAASCPASAIVYVDSSMTASGAGTSWATAFKTLTEALAVANSCPGVNQVWVKKGTYYPTTGTGAATTSRDSSFRILRNGIKVYGGFGGASPTMATRSPALYPTLLSGNIGAVNDSTDNSYHVITIVAKPSFQIDTATRLDGFEIRSGNAYGTDSFNVNGSYLYNSGGAGIYNYGQGNNNNCSPAIVNCIFRSNSAYFGGALCNTGILNGTSSPSITACTFTANSAGIGGTIYNYGFSGGVSSPAITNCIFYSNGATQGGAIYNHGYNGGTSSPTITACTFYSNTGFNGGAMYNDGANGTSNPAVANSIFYSNTAPNGSDIYNVGGATTAVSYSITQSTIPGQNNQMGVNPRFVSPLDPDGPDNMWATLDDGLRLDTCSPAIGAGSNGLIPAGIITDLTGAARIQLTTVDMGAYEHGYDFTGYPEVTISATPQPACAGVSVVFTATPANGGGSAAAYQWFRNSTSQQTSASPTFTTSTLANNDTVWAVLTNTYCGYFDTSNRFVVTITGISSAPGAITGLDTVCAGTTQPYSVAAVPGALSYIWSLPGGWTGTSTTASIATVPSATSGPVSVKVVNSCGISDSSSRMVTVRTPLGQPSAITGPASPCAGTSQTYSIAAMPGATSGYTWTLPAGGGWAINGPAAGNAIAVTVGTTSGTVTITASNGCGPGVQQTLSVTPNDVPAQPAAIAGNATPCTGVSTTYSVPAVPNTTSYTWTTPTGWTSTPSANSLATVPAATAGTVTVTAANICGPGASQTLTVTPVGTPAQPGAIASPAAICAGISGTYSVAAVPGATSYTWSLPTGWSVTGPATGASINATAGASGTISVIASTVCGASAPRTATVAVQTTPAQPAAITGASPVCSGTQNVYIAAPVSGATSYTWTLPPGWTGGSASGAILATAGPAGSGQITVSAQNACGTSGAASIPVVVNAVTPTSLSISPSTPSNVVCPGVPVTFTANATGAGLTPTYTWTRNGTAQQGFNSPTFTIANLQNGEVIGLSMASGAVCPAPATLTAAPIAMTVLPAVVPGININTQYSTVPVICAATQLDFVANIVGGGTAPTYQWWRNGAVVSTGGPTYSASGWTSGEVVYAMLLSNAQCATPAQINSNAVTVTVTPTVAPVVQISASPGTTFSAGQAVTFSATVIQGGGAAPLFQWMRNSQAIIGAFGPVYTTANLTGGDTISVRLTSGDPCAAPAVAFSNKVVMTKSTTSVGAVGGGGMGVSLYPNPNEGRFTLAITAPRAGLRTGVEVLNALGQVVYFREVVTERAEWTAPIELSGVANGIYLLRLKSEDGSVATMRFEVRR